MVETKDHVNWTTTEEATVDNVKYRKYHITML